MASEFEIIRTYLKGIGPDRKDVAIGIGDDAAVVDVNHEISLAMALDVLVEGVHFPVGTSADRIAHKALAVNLSDLAAMGATPAWFTLGLTLPDADDGWMALFSSALSSLADEHAIRLIGGDTTRGPLSISIHVCGTIPPGMAIERSGANMGDCVFITGDIGGLSGSTCAARRAGPASRGSGKRRDRCIRRTGPGSGSSAGCIRTGRDSMA